MSTDQDYNTSSKTPEQVKAAWKKFLKAPALNDTPARVERAFNDIMWRWHPVAKMVRKGKAEAAWLKPR